MVSPHLGKGSSFPQKTDNNQLRLYSMVFCPYAQRVRLVLAAKNIPYETININLRNKPEWLTQLNPEGKVPILDVGSQIIAESLVISDYLDEHYPENPLHSKDQARRQKDKDLISTAEGLIGYFIKAVFNKENKPLSEQLNGSNEGLKKLEEELKQTGDYFGGKQPGIVDYMIWPWAERTGMIPIIYKNEKFPYTKDDFPNLFAWYHRMRQQKPVIETEISLEGHIRLIKLYQENATIDYDQLYTSLKA